MNTLDNSQLKIIESDVASARITLSHLSQELVDHICCEVESLMENGKSFEEAYLLIKEQTGIKVLQKIQENTLYLIDKKYAFMKTSMKITGNVSLALLAIGTILKIYHLPAAELILVIGFAMLCLLFFPAVIYLNQQQVRTKAGLIRNLAMLFGGIAFMAGILFRVMHWQGSSALLIAGGSIVILIFLPVLLFAKLKEAASGAEKRVYIMGVIALMIFILSALFKMFHLPGTAVLLVVGQIMLVGVFLPMYSWRKFKESGKISGQFIFLIIISMYATVMTSLMALRVQDNILEHFAGEVSNNAVIATYYGKEINMELITPASNSNGNISGNTKQLPAVSNEANKLLLLIADIKFRLVDVVEQVDSKTATRFVLNPALIRGKDNVDAVNEIMIGRNGNGSVKTLRLGIEAFRMKAVEACSGNPALRTYLEELLDTSTKPGQKVTRSWEETNFRNNMLVSSLAFLTSIEKNVRIAETLVIRQPSANNTKH